MKNRKKVVVALLLVAVLCLGVGYAALTDTLFVNGTVSVKQNATALAEFAEDVHFTGTPTVPTGVTASIGDDDVDPAGNKDKLTITVADTALVNAGDKVKISADIINESADYGAAITLNAATSSGAYLGDLYSVTCAWAAGSTGTIAKGGTNTNTVEITIELLKTPTEDVISDTFTITFDVASVE
ncbi:MAG: hypothetical protein ACI3XQ_04095 [Eubacteriales bacterium]